MDSTATATRLEWPGELVATAAGTSHVRHRPLPGGDPGKDGSEAGRSTTGVPVGVLVHGLGGSASNWYELARQLEGELDAYALDLPGFGLSPPSPRHTLQTHADAVLAYLEARHADRPVHLIGNSMGGLVCVLAAAQRPDLVASLLLISPAMPRVLGVPREARLLGVLALPRLGERLVARDLATSPEAAVRRLSVVLFGEPELVPEDYLAMAAEERRARAAEPHAGAAFLGSLRSLVAAYARPRRLSAWRQARRLTMPVTVVSGGRDRLVREAAGSWRAAVPSVRLVHLPTSGHVAMMERPTLVADIVREHLADAHRRS